MGYYCFQCGEKYPYFYVYVVKEITPYDHEGQEINLKEDNLGCENCCKIPKNLSDKDFTVCFVGEPFMLVHRKFEYIISYPYKVNYDEYWQTDDKAVKFLTDLYAKSTEELKLSQSHSKSLYDRVIEELHTQNT